MAAQTPEVSSRLIDFQNGPVSLQPSASPLSGAPGQQGKEGSSGWGASSPPKTAEGRALKADPPRYGERVPRLLAMTPFTSLSAFLPEMAGDLGESGVRIDSEAINGSGRGLARCRVTDLRIDSHTVLPLHTCHVRWRGTHEVRTTFCVH